MFVEGTKYTCTVKNVIVKNMVHIRINFIIQVYVLRIYTLDSIIPKYTHNIYFVLL